MGAAAAAVSVASTFGWGEREAGAVTGRAELTDGDGASSAVLGALDSPGDAMGTASDVDGAGVTTCATGGSCFLTRVASARATIASADAAAATSVTFRAVADRSGLDEGRPSREIVTPGCDFAVSTSQRGRPGAVSPDDVVIAV